MDHAYADVNGVRLHYVTVGRGPLVMFVHGFPEYWYAWRSQLAEFGRDHQAVALDMRGYNLSSKPGDVAQYALPLLVEDVRALAAHLGHERFVVVGHDWGGVVSWALAAAHPEHVEKLVIINAPHPDVFARELAHNPAQQQAASYMQFFRSPQAEAVLSANDYAPLTDMMRRALGDRFDRAPYVEAWSQPGALTGGLNYYRAAEAVRPSEMIVRVPTLVIWGERDIALLTGNLDGLNKYVPDLVIERLPECSHFVVHEQPERVNALIREFMIREISAR
jgi:pimeloyl-ACP methyl ester carboxylesterase